LARAIDVDAPNLQEILRRAHEHKGTAFVEILQNCPVFNDNEWVEVENRKSRVDSALILEDGKPLLFGPPDQQRGIRIKDGVPKIVDLEPGQDPIEAGIAIHRERCDTRSYAFAIASLKRPDFPLPIGVLRAVEKPTYDDLLEDQVKESIRERGAGSLQGLLHAGETWTVDPS
jgi:2-oxoglutarate ferredoxin oxidoreductase subunit beta